MNNDLLKIDPAPEAERIEDFIKDTLSKQKLQHVVVGLSGGIDSATILYLLRNSLNLEDIHIVSMPYFDNQSGDIEQIVKDANILPQNFHTVSIKDVVDTILAALSVPNQETVRRGNVMARVRMITLFDLAKKLGGVVMGTENKSEHLLGYFTRFGDGASDIEPIVHLYKTQVYELAKHLGVPQSVIDKPPSANLWETQTDEEEMGFTYKEADQVLHLYFDKKTPVEQIQKTHSNAEKIIEHASRNSYKHETPYHL